MQPVSSESSEQVGNRRPDLDRVAEMRDELLRLGMNDGALRPVSDWLAARRAEQAALDPDVQYDDEPLTVCGQVLTFPHYAAPHEMKYANEGRTSADGQPCNRDCPGAYPCAVRKYQREQVKWIARALQDALYRRTGGREYAEWTGPLGHVARYGMSETGVWVQIVYVSGHVAYESLDANVNEVARYA